MSFLAKGEIDDVLEWEILIRDIWYLASMFQQIQFLHIKEGNQVAHVLVKHAMMINANVHWLEDVPKFVAELVATDIALH